jgi:RHS repeat-associated protein
MGALAIKFDEYVAANDNYYQRKEYRHADNQGSIIATTDGSGTVLNISSYDAYGVRTNSNASYASRFGYTGQIDLPEVGLIYYKARMYNPNLGRFIQTDPIGYGAGLNLYGYVGGDSINLVDPWGLDGEPDETVVVQGARRPCTKGFSCIYGAPPLLPIAVDFDLFKGGYGYGFYFDDHAIVTVVAQRRRKNRREPNVPHFYRIERVNPLCDADRAFEIWKQQGVSAPAGSAAQEGSTRQMLFGNNPIVQTVNSRDRVIVNTTERGHIFYSGTVRIEVSQFGWWSKSTITGAGMNYSKLRVGGNVFVGKAFFGGASEYVARNCKYF